MHIKHIFEQFLDRLNGINTSLKDNAYVTTDCEGEIRLKPPRNISFTFLHNRVLSLGFVELDTSPCQIHDWRWKSGERVRSIKDPGGTNARTPRFEHIRKTRVGRDIKFEMTTHWKGKVSAATETRVSDYSDIDYDYQREFIRHSYTRCDHAFLLEISQTVRMPTQFMYAPLSTHESSPSTIDVEIEILDTKVDVTHIIDLITQICNE